MQKLPITPIVTKISFPAFSAPPPGPLTPKRGEDTSGTRVRPHANFGVNRPAGCLDKKANKQKKTYSKSNTSPFALTSEWQVKMHDNVYGAVIMAKPL